jgi:hypothetical protein
MQPRSYGIVLLGGLAACTVPALILDGFFALANSPFLFIPFLALAHMVRRISRVGAATLFCLLVAGTVATQVAVYTTDHSTAAIALLLYPMLLVVAVFFGPDLSVRDANAYLRRHGK